MQRLGMVLLVAVVCSGCFRATTLITLKQDGSGTIDQEVGASAPALALLRNFSGAADGKNGATLQMFGPEQAQTAAAAMGVRFVSGEPVKTAELEGYLAHFAFDDVTKIKVDVSQAAGSAVGAVSPSEPPVSFDFAKQDGSSVLTIRTAQGGGGGGTLLPQIPGSGGSPQESAQAMALLTPMLRGLFVDVTLVVDGRIIKTSAPNVTGSRITLLQVDFDKVVATEGALQRLQKVTDPKLLKDIPGVQMLTEPSVTIEFGRQ